MSGVLCWVHLGVADELAPQLPQLCHVDAPGDLDVERQVKVISSKIFMPANRRAHTKKQIRLTFSTVLNIEEVIINRPKASEGHSITS